MSIVIKNISYIHSDRETLFQNINFSVQKGEKVSLIGKNGSGKSTLMKIIARRMQPSEGEIFASDKPYYIPQHLGQYNQMNISQALGIDKKIEALHAILNGDASTENFNTLNDDWEIEEKALSALSFWGLEHFELTQEMKTLSGGEKTKVFLAGIIIHSPDIILLDEPSNHLDMDSRKKLYDFIRSSKATIIIVSHDRTLLNLINTTYELNKTHIDSYGGNYEFYKKQKDEKINALQNQILESEKQLRHAKKIAREAAERKQKLDNRGEKKKLNEGTPRIMMNTLKDKAEQSSSKLNETHSVKIDSISENLRDARQQLPDNKKIKIDFENTDLHIGKTLINAEKVNYGYAESYLWEAPLDFQIRSGDRIIIKGMNGAGKTTLIKLITGSLQPKTGTIIRADFQFLYLDQEYSLLDNKLTIFEQVQQFNKRNLPEHELKMLLNRYLFPHSTWDKPCSKLSGGEKIKLVFCCLAISNNMPDMFILDEPTNNLDIQSLEIITSVIKNYKGTVLLISHDQYFIDEIGINKQIEL